jgi:hypothetical protein
MAETDSLSKRSLATLREDGVMGWGRQALLYLLRRLAWRSDAWSNELDLSISGKRVLRKYGHLLRRNTVFRDCHKGRRCFIIGNGPSLKKQDLTPLAREITLVTNNFYFHPLISDDWQPTYYFLSDPQYFDGYVQLSEFAQLNSRITTAKFFVPHFAAEFLEQSQALPPERTFYVATGGGVGEELQRRPDLTTLTPGMQTVVQLAIMVAMYMGCSPIYLLGLDHDWLSHGGEDLHFYSDEDAESQPDGHVGNWTYLSLMEAMSTMWRYYETLARVARSEGIEIFNCTRGGFLDVFARRNYEKVVANVVQLNSAG